VLLATLGGTDKAGDCSKIGRFGIGFFSIFNPALGTRRVRVLTRCEGQTVELAFDVPEADQLPVISPKVTEGFAHSFSTLIEVTFANAISPRKCVDYARRSLEYYPCKAKVNGQPHRSIWDAARDRKGVVFFRDGQCDGFIERSDTFSGVKVLCKYELVGEYDLRSLLAGSGNAYGFGPFYGKDMPYDDTVAVTINVVNLSVTVSRDSFMLDGAYWGMVAVLRTVMATHLLKRLRKRTNTELIRINQFILRDVLARSLREESQPSDRNSPAMTELTELLAEAKVYRLSGRPERVSLADIYRSRTEGLPVFFSPRQTNIRWLGGDFKHDFVVLTPPCRLGDGGPDFYDKLFEKVFDDVVNLDTIPHDERKIAELAAKGIIAKDTLSPNYTFRGRRGLTEQERVFLDEIDELLADRGIQSAITRHLHLPVPRITTGFIDVRENEYTIATGLFDEHGNALGENQDDASTEEAEVETEQDQDETLPEFSNLPADTKRERASLRGHPIHLGLRRDHPFIDKLIESDDPHRPHYALTFLAHELALCQKRLVPFSPHYHWVKEQMAADMRRALLSQLTGEEAEQA
jgi:hypothetical protein